MVKSIKHGVFFDQKYWTRHSKDARVLEPIYFSSLITGNTLRKCASTRCFFVSGDDQTRCEDIVHSGGQRTTIAPPTGEIDSESDYESDSVGAGETASAPGQDHEESRLVRATLTPGSFAA